MLADAFIVFSGWIFYEYSSCTSAMIDLFVFIFTYEDSELHMRNKSSNLNGVLFTQ
jgi:hypothetical protein